MLSAAYLHLLNMFLQKTRMYRRNKPHLTLWEVVSRFCDNNVRSAILQPTQKPQKHIIGMFIIQLSNTKPCSFAYWDNSLYCLLNSFSATSLSACSSEWQNSTAAFISLHLPPIIILSYTESECAQNWTVAFSGSPRLRTVAKDESIKP